VRPRGVGVDALGGDAGEAGRRAGTHERPDVGASSAEDDRKMAQVAADRGRGATRLDDVMSEHHDRCALAVPCVPPGSVERPDDGIGHRRIAPVR
jgi:hypothetical protein